MNNFNDTIENQPHVYTIEEVLALYPDTTLSQWSDHPNGGGYVHIDAIVNEDCLVSQAAIVRGGTVLGGGVVAGIVEGGVMYGGTIYGGRFCGGVMWSGDLVGGTILGGCIQGGTIEDGDIYQTGDIVFIHGLLPNGYEITLNRATLTLRVGHDTKPLLEWMGQSPQELKKSYGYIFGDMSNREIEMIVIIINSLANVTFPDDNK
jgi:hypothetical protein